MARIVATLLSTRILRNPRVPLARVAATRLDSTSLSADLTTGWPFCRSSHHTLPSG